MKKILFATNFSDSCENAFLFLQELISDIDIKVDILHVYQLSTAAMTDVSSSLIAEIIDQRKIIAEQQLNTLIEKLDERHRGNVYAIYDIYTSSAIAEIALNQDADLIIMGLREKYSMIDRLIGTTTAYTIKESEIPVLAIPSYAKYERIKDILFPTSIKWNEELLQPEKKALIWLEEFSQSLNELKIHFLHIDDGKPSALDISFKNSKMPKFDYVMGYASSVESGILEHVKNDKYQLLAFYKPQRKFWERLFHSGVTRKILYQSRIPLLIF